MVPYHRASRRRSARAPRSCPWKACGPRARPVLRFPCDLNFRKNLWKYGKTAQQVMSDLFRLVDIGIANEEDCQAALGIHADVDVSSGQLDAAALIARWPKKC